MCSSRNLTRHQVHTPRYRKASGLPQGTPLLVAIALWLQQTFLVQARLRAAAELHARRRRLLCRRIRFAVEQVRRIAQQRALVPCKPYAIPLLEICSPVVFPSRDRFLSVCASAGAVGANKYGQGIQRPGHGQRSQRVRVPVTNQTHCKESRKEGGAHREERWKRNIPGTEGRRTKHLLPPTAAPPPAPSFRPWVGVWLWRAGMCDRSGTHIHARTKLSSHTLHPAPAHSKASAICLSTSPGD